MAGLCAISIDSEEYQDMFLEDLFWGTFYQQHLGEQHGGFSALNQNKEIFTDSKKGLIRPNFEKNMADFNGTDAIGYCGHIKEPFFVSSQLGSFSVCTAGNILNLADLVTTFKEFGHTLDRGDDAEIVAKLIAQGKSFTEGIQRVYQEVKGSLSILVLTEEGIYASTAGHWPLTIGQKEGAVIITSDSSGFYNLGFSILYDLKPGEIVCLRNGQVYPELAAQNDNCFCSFWWVYTAFANDKCQGVAASAVRKMLGARLAKKDIEKGFTSDIVIPIPDSGRFHAIGYQAEFCRQINSGKISKVPLPDEALSKYSYSGRSFMPQTKEERDKEAFFKMLPSSERYDGLVLVVCDDSIVRGTQTQTNLVPKLKKLGFKEIHFRISNPPLLSYCPWGKTTTSKEELLSVRLPNKEDQIKMLGVDGLEYNTVEDLLTVYADLGIDPKHLCVDCDKL